MSAKRADEPLDILQPVPDGDICEDVADVAKLNLNVVFVPQQVVDLDAG